MTKDAAIERIMKDSGFPEDWRWYVSDVIDRKIPGCVSVDLETVRILEQVINIELKGG